ncbi:heavy metal transporter [Carbonactinospora thermoautotrophica]|uniref:heavy-metal-associated domain-containing protein n=1 Tax=Carbonactinospora thermoautotrophica TaxID=1469144 RepID=UPI00226F2B29|nr:heavy metal-associated domain-containing protein [Carbonactinospora thermoautotrophica]MCX9193098.1 heavy metal transporter [Carbonactinospora thermoautotrophica]
MTRLHFIVTGMHCTSCGLLIDDAVEELPGVTRSTTDVRTGRTTVDLDITNPPSEQDIIAAIAQAGYTATPAPPADTAPAHP